VKADKLSKEVLSSQESLLVLSEFDEMGFLPEEVKSTY
jgi:hypothetical protein